MQIRLLYFEVLLHQNHQQHYHIFICIHFVGIFQATDTDGLPEQTAQSEYYPERDLKKPSPNQGDFAETPTSPYAQFPTAPPRYPGFAGKPRVRRL